MKLLSVGLDLGTKVLEERAAYVLGLIMANERFNVNNKVYWQASIRHNPKQVEDIDLQAHLKSIQNICSVLGIDNNFQLIEYYKQRNINIEKYSAGKRGIIGAIQETSKGYTITDLINDIKEALLLSKPPIRQAFLVGVFDGRSSYDKTAKFISLDCDSDEIAKFLSEILKSLEIPYNMNLSRDRKSGGKPRKSQLRIKNLIFLERIGYISPFRFNKAVSAIDRYYQVENLIDLPDIKNIELLGV